MTTLNHLDLLLCLIRLGIRTSRDVNIPPDVDWHQIKALADAQGLSAIVLDGIDVLQSSSNAMLHECNRELPLQMKLEWIGEMLQDYEARYVEYEKAIASLAGWYNQHGFKMMVLKGYTCSMNWPKPEHRPCGDIDIWLFGKQKKADALINKEKGIKVDTSEHHHTVLYWQDFMVENHYDFINVHHHRSHQEIEPFFKELGRDDTHFIEIGGQRVYLPSPNLHALFLLKHASLHFASSELTMRQVLDWAFFVEKQGSRVDWEWLDRMLDAFGLRDFFNYINAVCVDNLGFSPTLFPYSQFDPSLKKRILSDILSPEFSGKEPKHWLPRVLFKYRRWKANEWKHKLCYKESMWSAFWSGVCSHMLKPSSI